MKKFGFWLLAVAATIIVFWLTGRITGMLQFYTVPSTANEPAIKSGEKIFTSNLKSAVRYRFITFTSAALDSANGAYMPEYKNGSHYLYRLCGQPGDILQMRNGVLFVNNKNFDAPIDLKRQYKTGKKEVLFIDEEDRPSDERAYEFILEGDSAIVTFGNELYKKYSPVMRLVPFFINDTTAAGGCFKWYDVNSKWTADNFGPLKIPGNNYFVMGDNRHFAQDSRYTGFVIKENIKGVVLGK